jgi:hypothetical protein
MSQHGMGPSVGGRRAGVRSAGGDGTPSRLYTEGEPANEEVEERPEGRYQQMTFAAPAAPCV